MTSSKLSLDSLTMLTEAELSYVRFLLDFWDHRCSKAEGDSILKDLSEEYSVRLSFLFCWVGYHSLRCYLEDLEPYPDADTYHQLACDKAKQYNLYGDYISMVRIYDEELGRHRKLPRGVRSVLQMSMCLFESIYFM